MDFDVEGEIGIFKPLFEKRPEISPEKLKEDLKRDYLNYVQKLIGLKKSKESSDGIIVGVSAIQGAGKTTQGEILEILLHHFGYASVSRSIDDHYITHKELVELRAKDPRFIRRGVTHDIDLAVKNLKDLQTMTKDQPVLVSGYDKGAHLGDGDRFRWVEIRPDIKVTARVVEKELIVNKHLQTVKAVQIVSLEFNNEFIDLPKNMGSDVPILEHFLPEELISFLVNQQGQEIRIKQEGADQVSFSTGSARVVVGLKTLPVGWEVITEKPDFIFYDGWMLGARKVEDESIFDQNLPALETEEAKDFAKMINKKLVDYEKLWEMIEFLNVLYVPNYQNSIKWRDQAEEVLRQKGEGMTHEQITDFVHYFWRSVHPAIHIKHLAQDVSHTNQVEIIGDDHSVLEILTPDQVKEKY